MAHAARSGFKTLEGWARLNPRQQERFLEAGVKAALRLGPKGFRHWLLRRVRTPPLAAPIDLAAYAISDGDMSAFLKTLTNDQHTHKGRKMGRCLDHFRDEGSARLILSPIEPRPLPSLVGDWLIGVTNSVLRTARAFASSPVVMS